MKKNNISNNLIQVIKNLYDKATSAVLINSSIGDWFRTTVGVLQECLLSPTLFNIFLERIITDALEDHEGTVSIGCRTITNLRFGDDIDDLAGEEEGQAKLVERLNKASTAYGMEISAEKTKLMTNSTSGINTEIKVNGQKLETVTSIKYLGSVITDEGSKPEILSRIVHTTAVIDKAETSLEWQEYFSQFQYTIDALPCHIHLPACLWIMDPHSGAPKKNTSHGNEVLTQDTTHLLQRPCYQHQAMDRLEFGKFQRAVENRGKWRKLVAKSSEVPQRLSRLRDGWDERRECLGLPQFLPFLVSVANSFCHLFCPWRPVFLLVCLLVCFCLLYCFQVSRANTFRF